MVGGDAPHGGGWRLSWWRVTPLMVGGGASRGLGWLVGGGGAPLVVWSFKYFTPIIAMWALFYPKKHENAPRVILNQYSLIIGLLLWKL